MPDYEGGHHGEPHQKNHPATVVERLLDAVWEGVVLGDSKWNPEKSCYDLAKDYAASGRPIADCVANFIDWQTAKAGGGGFILGLPGLAFGPITIPADLTYTSYLQLRMVATIALLHGWDPKSDQIKTVALLALIGTQGAEVLRTAGVHAGTKFSAAMLAKLPGSVLLAINRAVGFRLVTKAGSTGVVNLIKFIPIVGGLISGGLNAVFTRRIGFSADHYLADGPPQAA